MAITGPMWAIIWKAISSTTAKRIILRLLDALSHRSDNTIDDEFVHAAAEALEIRIPSHGEPTKPGDENIFLPDEALVEIKSARSPHEVVDEGVS